MVFKKKLYLYNPAKQLEKIETQRTKETKRYESTDPLSIQRSVRQLLANKISGNMVGIWLLIPEHLRLGTWDLLRSWTKKDENQIDTRLALQLVHEASLCISGVREKRTLSQKGFELAHGLPFVVSDESIHELLDSHTVHEAQQLQVALGKIRKTFGHFSGKTFAIDPHRIETYSKRQMVRKKKNVNANPMKMAQTFFCLDAETKEPVCFVTGTAARTVTHATRELLTLTADILNPNDKEILVLADNEHYTRELMDWVCNHSPFDILVPMKNKKFINRQIQSLPRDAFKHQWAGYATTKMPYIMEKHSGGPYFEFIDRKGEHNDDYEYSAFLCTGDRDEVNDLSLYFPDRWHIEEFFRNDQCLGWHRAGTFNLNIQYGRMTMALFAQASISLLRKRMGHPINSWDAVHLAKDLFKGLEGDIRVDHDTIIVTYYNAMNSHLLKQHYEQLPKKLQAEGVNPHIPWLFDFKLDFRFK